MKERSLSGYLKPYLAPVLLVFLLMIAEVAINTQLPALMSRIVDEGVLARNMEAVRRAGMVMLGLTAGGCVIGIATCVLSSIISQRYANDLRKDVYSKFLHLSVDQLDEMTTGSMVTHVMSDTQIVTQFLAQLVQMLIRPVLLLIFGLIMVLSISASLGWVFWVMIPIQVLLLLIFMKKMTPLFSILQGKTESINSTLQETLDNMRLVKAYAQEMHEGSRFDADNQAIMRTGLRVQTMMAVLNPLIMLLMNLAMLLILLLCGYEVAQNRMNIGGTMAAIAYVQQVLMAVMMVGQIFQFSSRARISAGRLHKVINMLPSQKDGDIILSEPLSQITLRDVTFRYPGAGPSTSPAIHHIDLDIHQGEYVAILGGVGSGKTTLASLLSRFYDPTGGTVTINGKEIRSYTLKSLRDKLVMVVQNSALCSGTVADNIRYGLQNADMEEVIAAARIAQAHSFIQALPNQYDTDISENGASLSGGQKQCIAIARALLRKPEVLILDDSTSAVDLATEARLFAALREYSGKCTMIVIAHRIASIVNADKIVVLDNGSIAGCAKHDELLARCGIYREMCDAQDPGGDGL
jgi:ATP-binding cassette subfamily B protein